MTSTMCWKDYCFSPYILPHLYKKPVAESCVGAISGFSIILHYIYVCLSANASNLTTVLKLGRVVSPTLFFHLRCLCWLSDIGPKEQGGLVTTPHRTSASNEGWPHYQWAIMKVLSMSFWYNQVNEGCLIPTGGAGIRVTTVMSNFSGPTLGEGRRLGSLLGLCWHR